MTIIGRLTKDADVTTLKDERQVVNFSIAINDWYKRKGSTEATKQTTFINCSYWISTVISAKLLKGALVELSGRISVNAYIGADGNARGALNFHVNTLTIHHAGKSGNAMAAATAINHEREPATDDLPF